MLAKRQQQALARQMRARGASLRAIARELDVALSSVSVWVRDVPTPARLLVASGAIPLRREQARRLPNWTSGAARRCYRCQRLLPDVMFGRAGSRQYRCRACSREYFAQRGDLHRQQSDDARRRRRLRAKSHVLKYLRSHPCIDCGEADPVVLEFDHLDDKRCDISVLAHDGAHPKRLDAEIALCHVVCVCCHRKRTAARRGGAAAPRERVDRNADFVRSLLGAASCVDCGLQGAAVLEFDHVGLKRADVSDLVQRGASLERLQAEIAECVVVCGNCHRRRTAARGGHFRFRFAQDGA